MTTTPGTNERAVADFAFGLILTVARAIPANIANVKAGRWERVVGPDVAHATLGIVGLGLIGKEVARRAHGFDMRILAYDVFRDEAFAEQYGVEYRELDDVLAEADYVTVHVPLMPQTRNLLDAGRLARLKPTAYVVNTARGGTVDEAALYEALTSGRLAGAALDVFGVEPAWGNPLLELPNVVATPHVAGIASARKRRCCGWPAAASSSACAASDPGLIRLCWTSSPRCHATAGLGAAARRPSCARRASCSSPWGRAILSRAARSLDDARSVQVPASMSGVCSCARAQYRRAHCRSIRRMRIIAAQSYRPGYLEYPMRVGVLTPGQPRRGA